MTGEFTFLRRCARRTFHVSRSFPVLAFDDVISVIEPSSSHGVHFSFLGSFSFFALLDLVFTEKDLAWIRSAASLFASLASLASSLACLAAFLFSILISFFSYRTPLSTFRAKATPARSKREMLSLILLENQIARKYKEDFSLTPPC